MTTPMFSLRVEGQDVEEVAEHQAVVGELLRSSAS